MQFPDDLRYTRNDEWVRLEGGAAVAGVTDYAQDQLSDVVFVELPSVGETFQQGDTFGAVESVKAAADLYMPIGGVIVEVNAALADAPELVNQDPYGQAWLIRFTPSDPAEVDGLMDPAAYRKYCEERAH